MKVDPSLIRARLDLPNFLHSRYGLTFQHGKARCLFADRHKNGDRNPSWVLSRDGRSVKCMAGDHFQGFQDCFGILMVFEGLGFPQAVQECLNFIRGIAPNTNGPSKRRIVATYGYVDEGG